MEARNDKIATGSDWRIDEHSMANPPDLTSINSRFEASSMQQLKRPNNYSEENIVGNGEYP